MNLVLDIGNTFAKVSVFEGNNEMYQDKMEKIDSDQIKIIFDRFPKIENAIISSVRKGDIDKLPGGAIKNFVIFNEKTSLPIKVDYETSETLGKDRIAAAVGARWMYPDENLLVIDAGTAITFEYVDKKGVYRGGNISPGLSTRLKALHHFTGKLPLVSPFETESALTGKSTAQAILGGAVFGMIYEIQGYINEYEKTYGNIRTILTGGDANYFVEKLKNSIFVVFNLNMIGLNRILEYNVITK